MLHPSRGRRILRCLALAALAATCTVAAPATADIPLPPLPNEAEVYPAIPVPTPQQDPWYADPADLAGYRNGDVIRSRVVQTYLLGVPIPVHATQLLVRSSDAHGDPLATASTVLMPGIPWLGPGPRPLISYQEAIDSLGQQCNPSYTLRAGLMKETTLLGQFLAAGTAVVITDFDGKNNTIMSPAEGRMVLDGIRAAQRAGLGLAAAPVGLWGYSGGGNATASAAEQHRGYAPELNVRASAQGGIPGDKVAIAPFAISGTQPQANFTGWLAVLGLAREYPEMDALLDRYLTPDGKKVAEDLSDRCLYTTFATTLLRPMRDYLTTPDALSDPVVRQVLADASFGDPGNTPDMPLLMWHSWTDQLLPAELAIDDVVRRYCERGVNLRYHKVPASEHISAELVPAPATVAWLVAVTAGADPGPTTC
ncbi:lipase family protein [Nocardia cyriacigeorgica]|uniref:lipase family protein n=1 Tax=Nocardia cyriacigeorgica TaxID=135487 RepID=UPI00245568E8|nr:lipase family protein [Nocardia cyriacigeorgica]